MGLEYLHRGGALPGSSPIEDYYQSLLSNDEDYAYSQTAYESSPLGRTIKSTLPGPAHKMGSGREMTTTYEVNDSETFATAAHGGTPAKTWAANTLQKTIIEDPDGKQTITYTDGWGQTIASGVDMNTDGKLTRGSDDLVTEFSYDLRGNLVRSEDPRGLATTYTYDERNLLVEKKLPDQTRQNKYCYDGNGQLRFSQSPNEYEEGFTYSSTYMGLYSYYKYDPMNRPVETGKKTGLGTFEYACNQANSPDFPQNTSANPYFEPYIKYSYDGDNAATNANNLRGRLTKVDYKDLSTGTWGSTSYSYNELGLVEWVIQDVPGLNGEHKIEYTYDGLGRKTQLVYNPPGTGNDHYTWYYYDELGRLEEVTSNTSSNESNAQSEATYSYSADGQPSQIILGGGVQTVDYRYRVQGWISSINSVYSMSSDAFALNLSYKNNGNISYQQWKQPGISTSYNRYYYSYDTANRLESACYSYSTCDQGAFDVTYNYNKSGNISNISRNNNDSSHKFYGLVSSSTSNKVMTIYTNGGVSNYLRYDDNGNMKRNDIQNIDDASYDWRNLPYSLTASSTMEYGYDAQGNRVRKEMVGGVEMHYVRGAEGETVAVYEDGSRDFVNLLANNEVIGIWTGSERRYFLKDHLGSTRTTVNENGNIIGYDDYYPFGLGMPTRSDNTGNGTATYKFTGHERDDEADITLDYMMARNYDPILGRFMQIDPLHTERSWVSPYNYAQNNPLNRIDPDGRMDQFLITEGKRQVERFRQTGQDDFFYKDKNENVRQLDPTNSEDLAIIQGSLSANDDFRNIITTERGTKATKEVSIAAGEINLRKGVNEGINQGLDIASGTLNAVGAGVSTTGLVLSGVPMVGAGLLGLGSGISTVGTGIGMISDVRRGNYENAAIQLIFSSAGNTLNRAINRSNFGFSTPLTLQERNILSGTNQALFNTASITTNAASNN